MNTFNHKHCHWFYCYQLHCGYNYNSSTLLRFYWSWSLMVKNNATQLTPPAHGWTSNFQSKTKNKQRSQRIRKYITAQWWKQKLSIMTDNCHCPRLVHLSLKTGTCEEAVSRFLIDIFSVENGVNQAWSVAILVFSGCSIFIADWTEAQRLLNEFVEFF